MHCLASGLLGWGWGQLWTARRPLHLLGAFAVAAMMHGLWNGAAVSIMYASMMALAQGEATQWTSVPGLTAIALVAAMALLTVVFLAALFLIARRLAIQKDSPQDAIVTTGATPHSPPRDTAL